jgi:hypothetical protein
MPAFAQAAPSLDRITVTGANIPRTNTQIPFPVQVVTRPEIDRTGKATGAEYLQTRPWDGAGIGSVHLRCGRLQPTALQRRDRPLLHARCGVHVQLSECVALHTKRPGLVFARMLGVTLRFAAGSAPGMRATHSRRVVRAPELSGASNAHARW